MLARLHRGDIGLDDDRCTTTDVIDLVCDLPRSGLVGNIVYDDGRAILSQTLGDGCTD